MSGLFFSVRFHISVLLRSKTEPLPDRIRDMTAFSNIVVATSYMSHTNSPPEAKSLSQWEPESVRVRALGVNWSLQVFEPQQRFFEGIATAADPIA